jgi:hypothetical protein
MIKKSILISLLMLSSLSWVACGQLASTQSSEEQNLSNGKGVRAENDQPPSVEAVPAITSESPPAPASDDGKKPETSSLTMATELHATLTKLPPPGPTSTFITQERADESESKPPEPTSSRSECLTCGQVAVSISSF